MFEKFGMQDCKPCKTPVAAHFKEDCHTAGQYAMIGIRRISILWRHQKRAPYKALSTSLRALADESASISSVGRC